MTTEVKNNNKAQFLVLSRIFNTSVLDDIIHYGQSKYFTEVYKNTFIQQYFDQEIKLRDFLDSLYSLLFRYYRNEYVYKNIITNKVLLGKHNPDTASMLTEFRVGKNKADVVILNGTSSVYEIKSEFDSFNRLESQVQTYFSIFDYVNVITSPSQAESIKGYLPQETGILVLTDKGTISTYRTAISNKENINPSILFDSLRKPEYIRIVGEYYGTVPNVPNTKIYSVCKDLFINIPVPELHNLVVDTLHQRNISHIIKQFLPYIPKSLSAYVFNNSYKHNKMNQLVKQFDKEVRYFTHQ